MTHSVLVVEDDPRFQETFVRAIDAADGLRLAGAASDVAEGLRLLDALQPDVLLVDLELPDGSGLILIRHAEERLPQCESMVITVFADDDSILKCIQAGATGYLLKDANALDIAHEISQLCRGGSPISPTVARRLLHRLHPPGPSAEGLPALVSTSPHHVLSLQELAVLRLSAKGYNYEEIAGLIKVSRHTVETYVKRIYRKLQVHSKTEAVYEARKLGLFDD